MIHPRWFDKAFWYWVRRQLIVDDTYYAKKRAKKK